MKSNPKPGDIWCYVGEQSYVLTLIYATPDLLDIKYLTLEETEASKYTVSGEFNHFEKNCIGYSDWSYFFRYFVLLTDENMKEIQEKICAIKKMRST